MVFETDEQIAVKPRVLFSGLGVRMIDNLMEHIADDYQTIKCEAKEMDFERQIQLFRPHVLVICMQGELRDDMRTYSILLTDSAYMHLPVLVIGKDEDCELFKKKIIVEKAIILERPVNMEIFLPELKKAAEESVAIMKLSEEKPEEKAPAQELSRVKSSILVVDDDVRMLNLIKMYLEGMYDVTVVPNGRLALKFLAKKHADLVLLDYMMPEMPGPQVLEEIRTTSPNARVPVLFLTGVADKKMVMNSLKFYPDGYLLKPISKDALIERVSEILLG